MTKPGNRALLAGIRDALVLPAWIVGFSPLGVGSLAHDAGHPIGAAMLSTVAIWASPAQLILYGTLSGGGSVDRAVALGITLLMDDVAVIGGVRFVGGTLWTDFLFGSFSRTHAFRSAQGRDGMVDYRRILAMHRATRAFLEAELAPPHDGPTVVVTHHAPHPDSLPSRHAHLAWCDASDLTDLIEARRPKLWVHGHVHSHADYTIGQTRIVCKARGHVNEVSGFIPDLGVEIG